MGHKASQAVQLDGYEQLTPLGRGGFSEVYRARQQGFDRWVAIKVLNVGLEERQRAAFERECRAMGLVSQHPNIVTVLSAAYTRDERPAIVMELYGGGTYAQRLRREGPLDPAAALDLGVRISGALHTAHEHGLLHRDVKPPNLFLSDYQEPALADFGISSFAGEREASGGLTVHYAAPEVIEGRDIGPAADVYALAATLFTLLAGRRPFEGRDAPDVALRILRDPPPSVGGSTPAPLDRLLRAAMAKEHRDRPSSAAAFGQQLQRVQQQLGLPPTTLPVPSTSPGADGPVVGGTDSRASGVPGWSGAAGRSAPRGHPPAVAPEPDSATVLRGVHRDDEGLAAGRLRAPGTPSPHGEGTPEDDEPKVGLRRVLISSAAAALVIGALGTSALLLSGRDTPEPPPPEPVVDTAVAEDDFLVRVAPPDDIEVARDGDTVIATWTAEPGLRYEVERVDAAGAEQATITVEDGEVVLAAEHTGQPLCLVVRSLSDAGQISAPSPPVCSTG